MPRRLASLHKASESGTPVLPTCLCSAKPYVTPYILCTSDLSVLSRIELTMSCRDSVKHKVKGREKAQRETCLERRSHSATAWKGGVTWLSRDASQQPSMYVGVPDPDPDHSAFKILYFLTFNHSFQSLSLMMHLAQVYESVFEKG